MPADHSGEIDRIYNRVKQAQKVKARREAAEARITNRR